jgi:hypothetical protein
MKIQIKHRVTGAVLYEGEYETVKEALVAGTAVGADLRGANLGDANLGGARNTGAAPPMLEPETHEQWMACREEERKDPILRVRRSRESAIAYRATHPGVPVVEQLNQKMLGAVTSAPESFDMGSWHGQTPCGTTHCRAGYAVHLAGEAGYALERSFGGTECAGRAIYLASEGFVPHFLWCERSSARGHPPMRRGVSGVRGQPHSGYAVRPLALIESDLASAELEQREQHPDRVAERVRLQGNREGWSWNTMRDKEREQVQRAKEDARLRKLRIDSLKRELTERSPNREPQTPRARTS